MTILGGVEGAETAASGLKAFKRLNEMLGFVLKVRKEVGPTAEGPVLGLEVDISAQPIQVRLSAERRERLLKFLSGVREQGMLLPGTAGTLAGKLQFACSGIYGRVGRAAVIPFYRRQRAKKGSANLSRALSSALEFFSRLLADPPAKLSHPPAAAAPPIVVYTDGNGAGCIGMVLFQQGAPPWVVSSVVPPSVLALLESRKQQIALIELIAVVVAFEVFAEALSDRDVLLFVDNSTAEGVIRNGMARGVARDASALASYLWLRCAKLRLNLFVQWVCSEENIADGPSRPSEPAKSEGLRSLGPVWQELSVFPSAVSEALQRELGWAL